MSIKQIVLIISIIALSEANSRFKKQVCDQSMDFSPVPGDCSKFYRCSNGQLIIMDCSSGLYFDNNLKVCNWPDQVTCNSNGIKENYSCSPTIDLTPLPGNCSQFYRCINNVQTILSCPSGYLFDRVTKTCNLANQVNCNSKNHLI